MKLIIVLLCILCWSIGYRENFTECVVFTLFAIMAAGFTDVAKETTEQARKIPHDAEI